MSELSPIINQVLPIFIFLLIGNRLRVYSLVKNSTIEELKKIVIYLALPAVLFLSFAKIDLDRTYLSLALTVFGFCTLLFVAGKVILSKLFPNYTYLPFMFSGFEYGMLGVSLFGAGYGIENIGYIAVADLGHEIFIWFLLVPMLLMKRGEGGSVAKTAGQFVTNPVIIGITAGLLVNGLGWVQPMQEAPVAGAVYKVLENLSSLVVPVILLIVGYGIRFKAERLREIASFILLRYVVVFPVAYVIDIVLVRKIFLLSHGFSIALFTLFVLPSPFIIPLFMAQGKDDEKNFINNVLAVQTLLCVCIFAGYLVLNPVIRQ